MTAVTNKQVEQLGITVTPMHPECELRAAGAKFESATAFQDFFANHVTVDGRMVTGQNQNAGAEVANLMMKAAGGKAPMTTLSGRAAARPALAARKVGRSYGSGR